MKGATLTRAERCFLSPVKREGDWTSQQHYLSEALPPIGFLTNVYISHSAACMPNVSLVLSLLFCLSLLSLILCFIKHCMSHSRPCLFHLCFPWPLSPVFPSVSVCLCVGVVPLDPDHIFNSTYTPAPSLQSAHPPSINSSTRQCVLSGSPSTHGQIICSSTVICRSAALK